MNLVEDWREWKRWWSMRWTIISTFCSSAALAYAWLPADWLPSVPGWVKGSLVAGALLSGGAAGVSRVVAQKPKTEERQALPVNDRRDPLEPPM
jgi:hypothetical protein